MTACVAGSTLTTLFTVPFSKKRKRDSSQQQQQWHSCHEGLPNGKQVTFPPDHYCMTLEQMEANNYPLPEIDDEGHMACPAGFIATQPAGLLSSITPCVCDTSATLTMPVIHQQLSQCQVALL